MLGQSAEVGALFGLGPEDAQGLKGRAARGRQRCCRASGGLHGLPPVGAACAGGQPLSPLRGQLPLHRGAKETAPEASPV